MLRFKKTLILLLALLLLPIAACKNIGYEAEPTAAPSIPAPYESGMTYHDVYDPFTDFDNCFGRGYPGFAESEDAYYYISTVGNYIYYYDKLTGERGVLCGRPECLHDKNEINEDCNGCIRADGIINYYKGQLYYTGYSDYGDSQVRRSLYRMEPDGTKRERLFPFTCSIQYYPGITLIHRGKLYGWTNNSVVESAAPMQNANLSCWDIETGEYKLIYDRTDEVSNARLSVFCFGKYVYICDSYFYPNDLERGTTVIILRWDTEKEELESVYRGDGYSGCYFNIWVESENRIFFAPIMEPDKSGSITVYCLCDSEVSAAVTVEGSYSAFLIDGAFLFFGRGVGLDEQYALITDFEGSTLYEGDWDIDVLEALPGSPDCIGYSAVYGSKDTVYIVYELDYRKDPRFRQCIVRYDLSDGEIVDSKLLCVSKW